MISKFPLVLAMVAVMRTASATPSPRSPTNSTHGHSDTVDYLIVGGGPAGMVVAEQLTRNPDVKVILLEAGPDPSLDPLVYSTSILISQRRLKNLSRILT